MQYNTRMSWYWTAIIPNRYNTYQIGIGLAHVALSRSGFFCTTSP